MNAEQNHLKLRGWIMYLYFASAAEQGYVEFVRIVWTGFAAYPACGPGASWRVMPNCKHLGCSLLSKKKGNTEVPVLYKLDGTKSAIFSN